MQIQSRLYMGNTEDTRSEIKRRVQNRNLIKSNYFYGKFYLVYQKKGRGKVEKFTDNFY